MPLRERLLETTRLPSREKVEATKKLDLLADHVAPQKIFDSRPVTSNLGEEYVSEEFVERAEERLPEQAIAPIWLEKWLALQQSFPQAAVQAGPLDFRASSSGANPQRQRRREVHNAFDYKKPHRKFLGGITVAREPVGQRITDQQTWSKPGVQACWTLNEVWKRQPSPRRKGDWAYQSSSDLSWSSEFA
jgi:hypothetical protein